MTEHELEDEQDRIAFGNLTFYPQVKYIRSNLRIVRERGEWNDVYEQIQTEMNRMLQNRLRHLDNIQQIKEDQEREQLETGPVDAERRRELEKVQLEILRRQNANEIQDEKEAARWASMLSDVCDRYIPSGQITSV